MALLTFTSLTDPATTDRAPGPTAGAALGTVKSHVLRGSERLREAMEKKT